MAGSYAGRQDRPGPPNGHKSDKMLDTGRAVRCTGRRRPTGGGGNVRAPRWSYVVMVTLLVAYGALLSPSLTAHVAPWLRDGVVGALALVVPVVVLVRAGTAHPERRPWTLPLAVAICLYLAGHLFTTFSATLGSTTFPSSADVGYLGSYPFLLAALLLALREDLRGARL